MMDMVFGTPESDPLHLFFYFEKAFEDPKHVFGRFSPMRPAAPALPVDGKTVVSLRASVA